MKTSICSQKKAVAESRVANVKIREPPPTMPPEQDLTGLVCWWCVHGLPQRPCIHLPVKYDEKLNRFTTIGNFCSWQCAKAYALDTISAKSGEVQSFLAMMRLRAFGKYVPLWPAPKRQFLKCFGGTMSIEEFRAFGGLVEPPQLYFPIEKQTNPVFTDTRSELIVRGPVAQSAAQDSTRLKAIENSTSQSDTLKLRRMKPLARAASKLESTLGITRKSSQKGDGDGAGASMRATSATDGS
jgi:hypothetical protein